MADSPPRFSMTMRGDRDKSRSSGVVPDPLPVQCAVPRRDFMPSDHERMLMAGRTIFQKRTRKPSVDVNQSPVCAERQLTDAYELMRTNRNPALYRPTKADSARSTSMGDQRARDMASGDVLSLKLAVLESIGANDDATSIRRALHAGTLARPPLDPKGLDANQLPHFAVYTRQEPGKAVEAHEPTYGHPNKPRIFNPLTSDWTRKAKGQGNSSAPGMSVAQLKGLLKPPPAASATGPSGGGAMVTTLGGSLASGSMGGSQGGVTILDDLDYATTNDAFDGASHGSGLNLSLAPWDPSFATQASVKEARNPLPHAGGSLLLRDHALAVPFREKVSRSKASAAGTLLLPHVVCHERQTLDRHDMSLLGTGVVRSQAGLTAELSPRREYQRDAVRAILKERRVRERAAAERVRAHVRAEVLGRIPVAPRLVSVNGPARSWNPSPLLGESTY